MQSIPTELLLSSEPLHVQICKVIAWRNLLYSLGVDDQYVQDVLNDTGGGALPASVDETYTSTYITLVAVEAVLINLYASTLVIKRAETS